MVKKMATKRPENRRAHGILPVHYSTVYTSTLASCTLHHIHVYALFVIDRLIQCDFDSVILIVGCGA